MNKTAIKNYAVWARNKLISDIEYKAGLLGVTDKGAAAPLPQSTGDVQFFDIGTKDYAAVQGQDVSRRRKFVDAIRDKAREGSWAEAFHQIVEKTAYTWFNRLAAIRFMEVNDYLPSHVRVLSSENENKAEPDMVTRPFDLDIAFSSEEQDHILRLQDENRLDELFRWLFVQQCRKLQGILPRLFAPMDDYMELLLTVSFTDKDGVLWHLVHDIPEDDFNVEREGQVEIIGWLYQYYNTEPKDKVFADLKKNIKVSKEKIPAATQLFTPDWIVRYMVENSLGRLWVEGHPNEELKKSWKYYLEEAPQEPQVQAQLDEIRKEYAAIRPEDIRVIDPCMGSGHILVYLFGVLMQIYESQGWTRREAARSIVENNLYGLDIDDRAAQLAYFAVMMKARQYDRRFLERDIQPHVYSTTGFSEGEEYGSLLITEDPGALPEEGQITLYDKEQIVRHILAQKYDVVVTNPPYMAVSNASPAMQKYVKDNYPDSKADLFAVFIEQCGRLAKRNGYQAMITQHAWMFLSSFEKLRLKLQRVSIVNLIHLGIGTFEDLNSKIVQSVAFVFRVKNIEGYRGVYHRLFEKQGLLESNEEKQRWLISGKHRYIAQQSNFSKIPGSPVAYWVSVNFTKTFNKTLGEVCDVKKGSDTGENDRYVRYWYEVDVNIISFREHNRKWIPYIKGGEARKWYGHLSFVVNWENNGFEIRKNPKATVRNEKWFYKDGITWSDVGSNSATFRYFPKGCLRDNRGPGVFSADRNYVLGLLNSVICVKSQEIVNPTICFQAGSVKSVPFVDGNIEEKTKLVYW